MTPEERLSLNDQQRQRYDADAVERGTRGLPPLSLADFRACNPALFNPDYKEPTLPDGMTKRVDVR